MFGALVLLATDLHDTVVAFRKTRITLGFETVAPSGTGIRRVERRPGVLEHGGAQHSFEMFGSLRRIGSAVRCGSNPVGLVCSNGIAHIWWFDLF